MNALKSLFAVLAVSFIALPAAAQVADPSVRASDKDANGSKVEDCDDVAACLEKAQKRTKATSRWVSCTIPPQVRILNEDGRYVVKNVDEKPVIQNGQCICPEGFELSKAFRLESTRTLEDGTIMKSWAVTGRCMPTNVEPNADIIVKGLNELREFADDVDVRLMGVQGDVSRIEATLNGHSREIALNAKELGELRGRVNDLTGDVNSLNTFMYGACAAPNLPDGWKKMCQEVDRISHLGTQLTTHQVGMGVGYTRYSNRNFFGAMAGYSLITPRLGEGVPVRIEVGARLGMGSLENARENADSALALESTGYGGLVFDLGDQERFKLHLRGFGQQATIMKGFDAASRRFGGELAFTIAPNAQAGLPGSFFIQPFANLGHGSSAFFEPATETQSSHVSNASGVTGAAGLMIGLQTF